MKRSHWLGVLGALVVILLLFLCALCARSGISVFSYLKLHPIHLPGFKERIRIQAQGFGAFDQML
jgi:hypothetical protein